MACRRKPDPATGQCPAHLFTYTVGGQPCCMTYTTPLAPEVRQGPWGTLAKSRIMTAKYRYLLELEDRLRKAQLSGMTVDEKTQEVLVEANDTLAHRLERAVAKRAAIKTWFDRKMGQGGHDAERIRALTVAMTAEYSTAQQQRHAREKTQAMEQVRADTPLQGGGEQTAWVEQVHTLLAVLQRDGHQDEHRAVQHALHAMKGGGAATILATGVAATAAFVAARKEIVAATTELYTTTVAAAKYLTSRLEALAGYLDRTVVDLKVAKLNGVTLAAFAGFMYYSGFGHEMCHKGTSPPEPGVVKSIWYFFAGAPPESSVTDKGWFCNPLVDLFHKLTGYQNGGAMLAAGAALTKGYATWTSSGNPYLAAAAGVSSGLTTSVTAQDAAAQTGIANIKAALNGTPSDMTLQPVVSHAAQTAQQMASDLSPAAEPTVAQIRTGRQVDGLNEKDAPEYAGNTYYVYQGKEYTVHQDTILGSGPVTTSTELQASRTAMAEKPSSPLYTNEAELKAAGAMRVADSIVSFTTAQGEQTEHHRQYQIGGLQYELAADGTVAASAPAPVPAPATRRSGRLSSVACTVAPNTPSQVVVETDRRVKGGAFYQVQCSKTPRWVPEGYIQEKRPWGETVHVREGQTVTVTGRRGEEVECRTAAGTLVTVSRQHLELVNGAEGLVVGATVQAYLASAVAGGGSEESCKASRRPGPDGTCPAPLQRYEIPQPDGAPPVPCCTGRQAATGIRERIQSMCHKLAKLNRKHSELEAALMTQMEVTEAEGGLQIRTTPAPELTAKLKRTQAKQQAAIAWLQRKITPPDGAQADQLTRLHMEKLATQQKKIEAEQKKAQIEAVTQKTPTGGGVVTLLHTLKRDGDQQAYDGVVHALQGGGMDLLTTALENPLLTAAAVAGAAYFKKEISGAVGAVWKATLSAIEYCTKKLEQLAAAIAAHPLGGLGAGLVCIVGGLWYAGILGDMCHADSVDRGISGMAKAGAAGGTVGAAAGSWVPGLGNLLGAVFGAASAAATQANRDPDYGWVCNVGYQMFQQNFGTSASMGLVAMSGVGAFAQTYVKTGNVALAATASVGSGASEYATQKKDKILNATANVGRLVTAAQNQELPTGLTSMLGAEADRATQHAATLTTEVGHINSPEFAAKQLQRAQAQTQQTTALMQARQKQVEAEAERTKKEVEIRQARQHDWEQRRQAGLLTVAERAQAAVGLR